MSIAASTNTWDINPARRPSLNDMGGASLEDDAVNPPDPNTDPTAASLNQCQDQGAALAAVSPAFILDVVNNGTTASLSRFSAPGFNIVGGALTIARVSIGLVSITWPSGTFPVSVANPIVQMTTDAAFSQPIPIAISNGVQVKCRDNTGALADGNFTIVFH